jgi:glycosyltransferase involved in cell wall biosynthesis
MRIALLNHSGEISGAEISLLQTATALAARGVELLFVVPESGDLAARVRAAGFPLRTIALAAPRLPRNPIHAAARSVRLADSARRLCRVLRADPVDVVHANSVRAGLIASLGRPFHGRPVVWSVRDFVPGSAVGLAVRAVAAVGACRVLANSNAVARDFARWTTLAAKTETIYPGVPASLFACRPGIGDLRDDWGMPRPAMVVGCVGQITPWKRIHDAINAFSLLAGKHPAARLVIVGAPKFRPENLEYAEALRRLVDRLGLGPRVRFCGFQEDIDRMFRSLDVLIHTAEREPFGRVLVEAMAHGIPVVATADGGIPEIVQDGDSGFLVPLGDTVAMAGRVSELLVDETERRRVGARGRARAVAFQTDRLVPRLEGIYRELVSPSRR